MTGIELIIQERKRQIDGKGFTTVHDSQHDDDELALFACDYAMPHAMTAGRPGLTATVNPDAFYPLTWQPHWAKRNEHSRIEQLAIAGALIAAEIDRLQNEVTNRLALKDRHPSISKN
jgi:hypothetical protein